MTKLKFCTKLNVAKLKSYCTYFSMLEISSKNGLFVAP